MSATFLTDCCRLNGYENAVTARHTAHLADTLVVHAGPVGSVAPVRLPGARRNFSLHRVRIAAADTGRLLATGHGARLVRAA